MNLTEFQEITKRYRGFNPEYYINKKIKLINNFFTEENLDTAVIALSGGIDSTLVLYLFDKACKEPDSPIKKILPVTIPINGRGTTGQKESTYYANLIMDSLNITRNNASCIDITNVYNELIYATNVESTPWAYGQMASVLRTPVLYYLAAVLQAEGYKSIVVGTTNFDEGSYIGFFGKASDGMVDLQPIADLHKSEVYQVAKLLDVPQAIIDRKPMGDVYDGKNDEEMIGVSYDFLEMYLTYMSMKTRDRIDIYNKLDDESHKTFEEKIRIVDKLHDKNAHKYKVGSPARFINVYNNGISSWGN